MKYVVQIFSPSGTVSSFDIDAIGDTDATNQANAKTPVIDEDGTVNVSVAHTGVSNVVYANAVASTASAAGKAAKIARDNKIAGSQVALISGFNQLKARALSHVPHGPTVNSTNNQTVKGG